MTNRRRSLRVVSVLAVAALSACAVDATTSPGSRRPTVTLLPSPSETVVATVWPDQDPSWVVDQFGSQTEPLVCGALLSDLPIGAVTISEARRATRDEVTGVIDEVLTWASPGTGIITSAVDFVVSDDMYLAAWSVDDAALSNYPPGTGLISTGLEVGFGPWEDEMLRMFSRQEWGGYAVVEDGVVVARGHQADATVGAGVINLYNNLISEEDRWSLYGTDNPWLMLITKPWQGVEWCPGVTPGKEGRALVVVAGATAPDRSSPTYAWVELPPD